MAKLVTEFPGTYEAIPTTIAVPTSQPAASAEQLLRMFPGLAEQRLVDAMNADPSRLPKKQHDIDEPLLFRIVSATDTPTGSTVTLEFAYRPTDPKAHATLGSAHSSHE